MWPQLERVQSFQIDVATTGESSILSNRCDHNWREFNSSQIDVATTGESSILPNRCGHNWREFNSSQIDVAHGFGSYRNNADRSVIVRFCYHTTATEVKRKRRNLKGTNIFLTEDLTPVTLEKYKSVKSLSEIKQA
ncbi:hypothetical protein PoB_004435100 [Plakobranchus ocellatus]|uniref:Uncharacterized protein n=1 Tax=Plakobranchus ocellatus TaxID=259542 RepID=A0AAV4B3B2_9GAST|nr:hypothetical protein PoB_004435100 [Plakobranchus ocellatus]